MATNTSKFDNFFIDDNRADVHVCNNKSTHFCIIFKNSNNEEYIITNYEKRKVNYWKIMKIAFQYFDGNLVPIVFHNVIYAGQFMTNLISQLVFDYKNCYFNIQNFHFNIDEEIQFKLHRNHVYFKFFTSSFPYLFLGKNKKFPDYNALTLIATPKFSNEWHKPMAHTSNEMIKYFASLVTNVKMIDVQITKIILK